MLGKIDILISTQKIRHSGGLPNIYGQKASRGHPDHQVQLAFGEIKVWVRLESGWIEVWVEIGLG